MPLRNEKTFTDEEMIAAFSIILPPEQAREEALGFNALPDETVVVRAVVVARWEFVDRRRAPVTGRALRSSVWVRLRAHPSPEVSR